MIDETKIRAFVAAGSALATTHVIPGNSDGPRPSNLYSTVLLVEDERRGHPTYLTLPDGRSATITWRAAQFSVQFYRAGAVATARRFVGWAESPAGLSRAEDDDIRIEHPIQVRRLDEIVADGFEERSQLDLVVEYVDGRDTTTADERTPLQAVGSVVESSQVGPGRVERSITVSAGGG